MGNVNTRNSMANRTSSILGSVAGRVQSGCAPMFSKCCSTRDQTAADEVVNNYQYDVDASKRKNRPLMSSMSEDPMASLAQRNKSEQLDGDNNPLIVKQPMGAVESTDALNGGISSEE